MPTAYFSVKNFEQFQHYRDRNPIWIKLYNALLEDYAFCELPDNSKAHLLAIWLLASRTGNRLPFDAGWIGRRISANTKVNLEVLVEQNFIILEVQENQHAPNTSQSVLAPCYQDASLEREKRESRGEKKKQLRAIKNNGADPRHKAFIDDCHQTYKTHFGVKPNVNGQDAKRVSEMLKRLPDFSPDELIAVWWRFLGSEDKFHKKMLGGHPIAWFAEHVNEFLLPDSDTQHLQVGAESSYKGHMIEVGSSEHKDFLKRMAEIKL